MTTLERMGTSKTDQSDSISTDDSVLLWCKENQVALEGNGSGQPLNKEQMELILALFAATKDLREQLDNTISIWCDYETCRRYLVARQWKLKPATTQLRSTLEFLMSDRPGRGLQFWQSPKALADPYSLSMRLIGWDKDGRPICYTCFAEAHDRWDVESNTLHMELLMEASTTVIRKRVQNGLNTTASSRQWTWVIDFDGFSFRDQNPKSGLLTIKLMNHFPEMLHSAVLINAPYLFRGLWELIRAVLDDRVRQKVHFMTTAESSIVQLRDRMGDEAVNWILAETKDNLAKRQQTERKRYWVPPSDEEDHDSRGLRDYVESEYYVKTPGDAWQEQQEQSS